MLSTHVFPIKKGAIFILSKESQTIATVEFAVIGKKP
jgi:hypothetical protein